MMTVRFPTRGLRVIWTPSPWLGDGNSLSVATTLRELTEVVIVAKIAKAIRIVDIRMIKTEEEFAFVVFMVDSDDFDESRKKNYFFCDFKKLSSGWKLFRSYSVFRGIDADYLKQHPQTSQILNFHT